MLDHPMAPSSMHGRHRSRDDSEALMHGFPTLQESSLGLHEEVIFHLDIAVLELHQRRQSPNLTFPQLGINVLSHQE